MSTVLAELWRDEVLPENVANRVLVPKNAPVDGRDRVARGLLVHCGALGAHAYGSCAVLRLNSKADEGSVDSGVRLVQR